jgi:hypothetical protein
VFLCATAGTSRHSHSKLQRIPFRANANASSTALRLRVIFRRKRKITIKPLLLLRKILAVRVKEGRTILMISSLTAMTLSNQAKYESGIVGTIRIFGECHSSLLLDSVRPLLNILRRAAQHFAVFEGAHILKTSSPDREHRARFSRLRFQTYELGRKSDAWEIQELKLAECH